MSQFAFLEKTPGDSPESKMLTNGVYTFAVKSYVAAEEGEAKKGTVRVNVRAVEVKDSDFLPEDLQYVQPARLKFWHTDAALAQPSPTISAKVFLRHVIGGDMSDEEFVAAGYPALYEQTIGKTFVGEVRRGRSGKNQDGPEIANIVRIFRAAE